MEQHGVSGGPRALLRLEGMALLGAAALAYWRVSGDWKLFAILFLVPDVSFLFYLFGPRPGAAAYNTMHSTLGPFALGAFALATGSGLPIALIWAAHAGFDRMLGYGLKYSSSFSDTHLGRIGFGRKQEA